MAIVVLSFCALFGFIWVDVFLHPKISPFVSSSPFLKGGLNHRFSLPGSALFCFSWKWISFSSNVSSTAMQLSKILSTIRPWPLTVHWFLFDQYWASQVLRSWLNVETSLLVHSSRIFLPACAIEMLFAAADWAARWPTVETAITDPIGR